MSYRKVNSYACSFCDSKFGAQADLDLHNQLHVDTGEFSCPLCKAIFPDLHQLQLHDLRHSLEETGEEANNPSALISYIRPSSSFSCDICKEVFATNEELCIHSTIHEEVKEEQLSSASESEVKSKMEVKEEQLSSAYESEVESKMEVELLPSPPEKVRKSSRPKRTSVKNASVQSDSDDINACHICKKIFTCASSLRRHNRRIHLNKKPYTCTICHRRFLQLSLLSRHSLLHHKNKKEIFECQYCEMKFSKSMILQKHIFMTHVCQDKHFCYACYKFFSNKDDLENHMKEHLVSETYECETCKKRYTNETDLKKHRCENRGSRRFPCKICGKRFNRLHHLERHTAVHERKTAIMKELAPDLFEDRKPTLGTHPEDGSNDNTEEELWTVQKKFQCYICDKRWSSFKKYKQHFLTIHKEVEFNSCHICSKKFTKSSKVRRHLLTHNREKKKYQCDTCDRTFTTVLTKNRHMKTCDEQRARYESSKILANRKKKGKNTHFECAVCGEKFVEEKFLDKHILAFHDFFTEFQCNLCERKFNSHYHLKQHMLDHADIKKYKCFRCNMTFRSRSDLKNHIQSHEELKPFPCYFCDRFFSRNYHRQKHLAVCAKGRKVIVPKEEVIDISEEEKVDMPTTTACPLIELVEPKSENSE